MMPGVRDDSFEVVNPGYAEAIADGVGAPTMIEFPKEILVQFPTKHVQPITFLPQVPASTVQDVAYSAAREPAPSKSNASRRAWRKFKHLGYGWMIPLRSLIYETAEGDELDVPYANPVDTIQYLMTHKPSLLVGGILEHRDRLQHLQAFWHAYRDFHPEHPVYREHAANLSRVIPVCWHGDEGRGKKRGQTVCISVEAVIGLYTSWNIQSNKRPCTNCGPSETVRGMFPVRSQTDRSTLDELAQSQWTNMKGHSFLQHFPVFVLPGSMYKQHKTLLDVCLDQLGVHLRQGFFEGFDIPGQGSYFIACVGAKGDLKWAARAGGLSRSFEHLGRRNDLEMCHECCAGANGLVWEDVATDHPCWEGTIYTNRPWQPHLQRGITKIPYDLQRPEAVFRRDVFHLCKVGVYRDFVGSSILLLCSLGYFGLQGGVPEKLETAHSLFKLFCQTTHRTPGLRSFSRLFFNYPNASSFGWTNSKGSDTMMMMEWIRVFCVGCTNALLNPQHREVIELMYLTAQAGKKFFEIMNGHGLFLTFDCMLSLWAANRSFIRGYARLANTCHHQLNFKAYAIKPKLHLLRHQEVDAFRKLIDNNTKHFPNPILWGCERNEDYIGHSCKLSRRCDSRLLCKRVIECIFLKGDMVHRRWLRNGPRKRSSKAKTPARTRPPTQRRRSGS